MRSCSPPPVERARPLLGTRVAIRACGLAPAPAHTAIEAAFEAIAEIQHLMSFQDVHSELSCLHRHALYAPVTVHPHTHAVLTCALALGACSQGRFDVTVAGELVAQGRLPMPDSPWRPEPGASWRDVELNDYRVRFHRPLWLDLGGIAKGYAVDRAIDCLRTHGATQGCVNAGGDLRCFGAEPERIQLRSALFTGEVPLIELSEGSLASSSTADPQDAAGWHIDGRTRRSLNAKRFTCVLTEQCLYADALTKITLAAFEDAAALLEFYAATAYHYDAEHGWRMLGG